MPIDDVWNAGDAELALRGRDSLDSIQIKSFSTEKTGYATQKNESLLRRIVEASSNPGDLVLDAFCGSGTTLAVATELGRRWIGCDTGRSAIEITTRRLLAVERARGFERLTVADDERRQWSAGLGEAGRDEVEEIRACWRALAGDGAGPLRVEEAIEGSPPAGPVAAWRWAVEVPVERSGDAVEVGELAPSRSRSRKPAPQLVVQRAIVDPQSRAQPGLALAERARLRIRLHGLEQGRVEVELLSLVHPTRSLLPEALASAGPLDLVEHWSLAAGPDAGGPVFAVYGRFDRARTLPQHSAAWAPAEGARTVVLSVRVHDALHREHRLELELSRRGKGLSVTRARALAEGEDLDLQGAEPGQRGAGAGAVAPPARPSRSGLIAGPNGRRASGLRLRRGRMARITRRRSPSTSTVCSPSPSCSHWARSIWARLVKRTASGRALAREGATARSPRSGSSHRASSGSGSSRPSSRRIHSASPCRRTAVARSGQSSMVR